MIWTIILTLYLITGACFVFVMALFFTHTEMIEEVTEEEITEIHEIKMMIKNIPEDRILLASFLMCVIVVMAASAMLIAWPVIMLAFKVAK